MRQNVCEISSSNSKALSNDAISVEEPGTAETMKTRLAHFPNLYNLAEAATSEMVACPGYEQSIRKEQQECLGTLCTDPSHESQIRTRCGSGGTLDRICLAAQSNRECTRRASAFPWGQTRSYEPPSCCCRDFKRPVPLLNVQGRVLYR